MKYFLVLLRIGGYKHVHAWCSWDVDIALGVDADNIYSVEEL